LVAQPGGEEAAGTMPFPPNLVHPDKLIAELAARAPKVGANIGAWPGVTICRFTSPAQRIRGQAQPLLLLIVAQGSQELTVDGETYVCGPTQYLVLGRHVHFEAEILEASTGIPFLSFVLRGQTAVITMTLTSAACPLTAIMENQIRSGLARLNCIEGFRVDWQWIPAWRPADITDSGREQLRAIGFTI
jgi:AraC-type transcriptional regulator N-terminus